MAWRRVRRMVATLHKYIERGPGTGFSNLTLASGERLLLSLARGGISIHRLYLRGLFPGRAIHAADAAAVERAIKVLARDLDRYPELPNDAAMQALLVGATAALTDPDIFSRGPSDGNLPLTPLSVVTRAALAQEDSAALIRLLTRAANIV
jgi:hypothetical protein